MIQALCFTVFCLLERLAPARPTIRAKGFATAWLGVNLFAVVWIKTAIYYYVPIEGLIDLQLGLIESGLFYYLIYSFIAYWYHRGRHCHRFLWRYIHKFHHSSPQMETLIAFYKHPTEYLLNSLIILGLGYLFSMPIEAIAMALAIEGCLECFHHSNIRIPKKFNWIGWIIQTPEMHLIHHEYGTHRYNYATFLWDTVFKTARISTKWNGQLGFDSSFDTYGNITFKK